MAELISDQQRQLNQTLHAQDEKYGNRADANGFASHLPTALVRMHELGVCDSVLDYGTGKGMLVERLRRELPPSISVKGYDPAVEQYAELLTCLDVLEHIEMDSIDAVLREVHGLTRRFCYLVIDLQPAVKTLADGRNAHILLAPPEWWTTRLAQLFPCLATFPILHKAGPAQKLVVAAAHSPQVLPLMYGFLNKLKLYNLRCVGGVLAGLDQAK